MPWCTNVETIDNAVISWPPPGVPVETNTLAYLPASEPCAQSPPVASQKVYVAQGACQHDYISLTQGRETHLELRGHVAVASRDTEDEGIEFGEVRGLEDGIGGLGGRAHLGEDLLGERLGDPEHHTGQRTRRGATAESTYW